MKNDTIDTVPGDVRNDYSKAGTIWTDSSGERYIECARCNQDDTIFEVQLSAESRPHFRAWYNAKEIAKFGLVIDLSSRIEQALSEGGASAADYVIACARLPHGYETDHAALRAIVTFWHETTIDATIAYYAVPYGTDHGVALARMTRLDSGTRELRSLLAQIYPATVRTRLADLGLATGVKLPADRAWYQRLSADAIARLDGDMSRPLPESADLDAPGATRDVEIAGITVPIVSIDAEIAPHRVGVCAVEVSSAEQGSSMEQGLAVIRTIVTGSNVLFTKTDHDPTSPFPVAAGRPFIETHDEHPIEHG